MIALSTDHADSPRNDRHTSPPLVGSNRCPWSGESAKHSLLRLKRNRWCAGGEESGGIGALADNLPQSNQSGQIVEFGLTEA